MTRRNNDFLTDRVVIPYDHAQLTATTTVRLFKPKNRQFLVESVRYINPTGLAVDVTNYMAIQIKQGAVVLATWSTETGEEGAFVADTYVDFALSTTGADNVIDADEVLTVLFTEGGAVTLPPGRFQIEGRYL